MERTLRDNKYIEHFEFANFPGHAITNVSDAGVNADVYVGASDKMWKSTSLKRPSSGHSSFGMPTEVMPVLTVPVNDDLYKSGG